MGVRGLQSFLKKNTTVSRNWDLADSSLIIDGANLSCCLFANQCNDRDSPQKRNDIYGGDIVSFTEMVRSFFAALDKCNITPILVFDGSVSGKQSTQDQRVLKEKTVYQRGLENFNNARTSPEENPNDKINMPQGLSGCFKRIANELGIQRIQTAYEADSHIARLANELNCPVLTNDSDFIIYSLPIGFIMIDSFQYTKPIIKNGKNFINCLVYQQEYLVRCLPSLDPGNMPLMSVLLGNDYVEAGTFDRILESIVRQNRSQSALIAETFAHRRIASLLNWLRGKTQQEAIEIVLDQVHPNHRERLRQTINILLRSYRIEAADDFESELDEIYSKNVKQFEAISDPDLKPSRFIRRLMEVSNLSASVLDIIFHNTHYTYISVEDFQLPSSSFVKFRPLSVALALLRANSYEGLSDHRLQQAIAHDTYYVFDRCQDQYMKMSIKPMEALPEFGSLEHLNIFSTMALDTPLKRTILMSTFRFTSEEWTLLTDVFRGIFIEPFVQEATICLTLVKYIGLETKMNPKPQFIDSLLLTLFYYAALNGKLVPGRFSDQNYGKLLLKLRPHTNSNNGITYSTSESLYRRIVHFIRQLHHAYTGYNVVNGLLKHVFPGANRGSFMNAVLIFRITKLLRLKQLELNTLCHELPALLDACSTIKVLVHAEE